MRCTLCEKAVSSIIADTLRGGEKRNVYFCENCELGILDSDRSEEELKKFYSEEYRNVGTPNLARASNPDELFKAYSRFQGDRLGLLAPHLGKKTKLLEVGCSAGMFLHHVKDKVGEIAGIDFDRASAEYAAKKCACKVYTEDIRKTPLKKGYFDVIAAFQTLEHVKDPHDFLESLKEYLAPGGIIAIEVPNLYDALAYAYDLPNHYRFYYHASHLWYFTEKSLDSLMGSRGFKGSVHHIQDYNILNHLHWIDTDTPEPDCEKGLSLPILPLRRERDATIKKALSDFIVSADARYKETLERLKITSNILYIGKAK